MSGDALITNFPNCIVPHKQSTHLALSSQFGMLLNDDLGNSDVNPSSLTLHAENEMHNTCLVESLQLVATTGSSPTTSGTVLLQILQA